MGQALATLLLIGVTAIWGWTFVVVGNAVAIYPVVPFLALRFTLAAAVLAVVWRRHLTYAALRTGAGIGTVLAAGYLFQTVGLTTTTPTNAGLLTGLFVVFAPVADRLLYGHRIVRLGWLAVGVSLVGMILLSGGAPTSMAAGDVLELAAALGFGLHVALLSRHSPSHDPRALTLVQMLVAAVIFCAAAPLSSPLTPPPPEVWLAVVITGLLASALAYFIQTVAQRRLSAARTAVILTLEPAFAAVFGFLLAGDRLGPVQAVGALLILAALSLAELAPRLHKAAGSSPVTR